MGFIITLILVGLVLIFVEILLVPGIGVAGVLGLLSIAGSCFYTFYDMGTTAGLIVTIINAILLVGLTVYVLRAKTWKRMSLETKIDSKAVEEAVLSVGDKGKTVTRLAPMGSARFGNNVVEVKALEGMLEPGISVTVVLIEDNRIYVRPLAEEF